MSWLLLATVVDVGALAETALAALVGGVTVTLAFSLAIAGASRAGELREAGHHVTAAFAAALGAVGLLAAVATIVVGLVVMAS
jgi:hypothetical protein